MRIFLFLFVWWA